MFSEVTVITLIMTYIRSTVIEHSIKQKMQVNISITIIMMLQI